MEKISFKKANLPNRDFTGADTENIKRGTDQ